MPLESGDNSLAAARGAAVLQFTPASSVIISPAATRGAVEQLAARWTSISAWPLSQDSGGTLFPAWLPEDICDGNWKLLPLFLRFLRLLKLLKMIIEFVKPNPCLEMANANTSEMPCDSTHYVQNSVSNLRDSSSSKNASNKSTKRVLQDSNKLGAGKKLCDNIYNVQNLVSNLSDSSSSKNASNKSTKRVHQDSNQLGNKMSSESYKIVPSKRRYGYPQLSCSISKNISLKDCVKLAKQYERLGLENSS
jgi:hypothetical protein